MLFQELIHRLEQRLQAPLPGETAHQILRAVPVGGSIPKFEFKMPPRPGSVLILLYAQQGAIKFPLIKRPEYPGAHSGQISFPGGKAEPDEDPIVTALRESEEEIGISANEVKVIGTLSNFFVMPSNFLVTPVVAVTEDTPQFRPDPYEVAGIIHGNLNELVQEDAIKTTEILAAGRYRLQAPHFFIEDQVVWGATAMILNEFRFVLREIWDDGNLKI